MLCPYSKTADGFEMHLGVNHLGKASGIMFALKWNHRIVEWFGLELPLKIIFF